MTEQQNPEPQATEQQAPAQGGSKLFGILSTVAGGISMAPFLGVVSPIGLVLGIIGLFKDGVRTMAIIGTSVSLLGIFTSPILWGLVGCAIDPDGCKIEETKEGFSDFSDSMQDAVKEATKEAEKAAAAQ